MPPRALAGFFDALALIQLSLSALLRVFTFLNMHVDTNEIMLASIKQQERGRKVAEDSSLQAKAKKADPKWLRKLGLDDKS